MRYDVLQSHGMQPESIHTIYQAFVIAWALKMWEWKMQER